MESLDRVINSLVDAIPAEPQTQYPSTRFDSNDEREQSIRGSDDGSDDGSDGGSDGEVIRSRTNGNERVDAWDIIGFVEADVRSDDVKNAHTLQVSLTNCYSFRNHRHVNYVPMLFFNSVPNRVFSITSETNWTVSILM